MLKKLNTKERILQTALKLFNARGYTEVGVREIARALSISPGNLSYHFSKKEDIFIALIKQHSQKNDSYFNSFFSTEATLEKFLMLMKKMLHAQYKKPGPVISIFLYHP